MQLCQAGAEGPWKESYWQHIRHLLLQLHRLSLPQQRRNEDGGEGNGGRGGRGRLAAPDVAGFAPPRGGLALSTLPIQLHCHH